MYKYEISVEAMLNSPVQEDFEGPDNSIPGEAAEKCNLFQLLRNKTPKLNQLLCKGGKNK